MCVWFSKTFRAVPDPEIPLNNVRFVDSWDEIDYVKITGASELFALFYAIHIKDKNEIVILDENLSNDYWGDTQLRKDSLIAHELVHYLTKASQWEKLNKVDRMHMAVLESHAYWSQDQYIRRKTNGAMNLYDVMKDEEKNEELVDNFVWLSSKLYDMDPGRYLYNAVIWFNQNPVKNFEDIVKGRYIYQGILY